MDRQPYPYTWLPTFNTNVTNTSLDVFVQDQHSLPIDLYATNIYLETTLYSAIERNAYTIQVREASWVLVWDACNVIYEWVVYQSVVVNVVEEWLYWSVTVNIPFEYGIEEANVNFWTWNMNIDWASRPIMYKVQPPAWVSWDITRIMFSILDWAEMDDWKFWWIEAIEKWIYLFLYTADNKKNLFTVFDNWGFAERCFDTRYSDKAPAWSYGFIAMKDYKNWHWVTIRLNWTDWDYLAVAIQDDLTSLEKFSCVMQGHTVI